MPKVCDMKMIWLFEFKKSIMREKLNPCVESSETNLGVNIY
jgi:hypothetical protein